MFISFKQYSQSLFLFNSELVSSLKIFFLFVIPNAVITINGETGSRSKMFSANLNLFNSIFSVVFLD